MVSATKRFYEISEVDAKNIYKLFKGLDAEFHEVKVEPNREINEIPGTNYMYEASIKNLNDVFYIYICGDGYDGVVIGVSGQDCKDYLEYDGYYIPDDSREIVSLTNSFYKCARAAETFDELRSAVNNIY